MSTDGKRPLSPQAIFAARRRQMGGEPETPAPAAKGSTISPQAIFAARKTQTKADAGGKPPTAFQKQVSARVAALSGKPTAKTNGKKPKQIVIPDGERLLPEGELYDRSRVEE